MLTWVLHACYYWDMTTDKAANEEQKDEKAKSRGPGVPTINLERALKFTRDFWAHEKRNPAPVVAVLSHWGYSAKSSGGFLAVASMKRFGLMDETGNNEKRTLKLSTLALDLLKTEETDPATFKSLLKQAALRPEMHAHLWEKYGHELPSDKTLQNYLVFDKHYSDDAAKAFINEYRDTISFAKLTEGATLEPLVQPVKEPKKEENMGGTPPPSSNPPKRDMPLPTTAELPVPIADGLVARVPYPMSEEDFELLIGTLRLWKKKLVKAVSTEFPKAAIWKNQHTDKPVTIVAEMGERDGERYFQSKDGTGIPESELSFADE